MYENIEKQVNWKEYYKERKYNSYTHMKVHAYEDPTMFQLSMKVQKKTNVKDIGNVDLDVLLKHDFIGKISFNNYRKNTYNKLPDSFFFDSGQTNTILSILNVANKEKLKIRFEYYENNGIESLNRDGWILETLIIRLYSPKKTSWGEEKYEFYINNVYNPTNCMNAMMGRFN